MRVASFFISFFGVVDGPLAYTDEFRRNVKCAAAKPRCMVA
jgi:hypothetical protein